MSGTGRLGQGDEKGRDGAANYLGTSMSKDRFCCIRELKKKGLVEQSLNADIEYDDEEVWIPAVDCRNCAYSMTDRLMILLR